MTTGSRTGASAMASSGASAVGLGGAAMSDMPGADEYRSDDQLRQARKRPYTPADRRITMPPMRTIRTALCVVLGLGGMLWGQEWKPAANPIMTPWADKVDPKNPLPE